MPPGSGVLTCWCIMIDYHKQAVNTHENGGAMLTLEEIREALKDRKISMVAEETGLSRFAIYKLVNGETNDPHLSTVQVLSEYLTRKVGAKR
jgi:DNA-binding phage protein